MPADDKTSHAGTPDPPGGHLRGFLDSGATGPIIVPMSQTKRVVFVVDDEPIIANTLAMILNNAGFDARSFVEPFLALEAAKNVVPDLLISDVVMPKMTGIELAIHFRKEHPECRVLLFSGQARTADMLQTAHEQGYDFDILAKPIHPAELLAKLRS
jgi:DNA-binding NtrC family response regulator